MGCSRPESIIALSAMGLLRDFYLLKNPIRCLPRRIPDLLQLRRGISRGFRGLIAPTQHSTEKAHKESTRWKRTHQHTHTGSDWIPRECQTLAPGSTLSPSRRPVVLDPGILLREIHFSVEEAQPGTPLAVSFGGVIKEVPMKHRPANALLQAVGRAAVTVILFVIFGSNAQGKTIATFPLCDSGIQGCFEQVDCPKGSQCVEHDSCEFKGCIPTALVCEKDTECGMYGMRRWGLLRSPASRLRQRLLLQSRHCLFLLRRMRTEG